MQAILTDCHYHGAGRASSRRGRAGPIPSEKALDWARLLDTPRRPSQNAETMSTVHRTFVSLFAAAGLLVSGAVFADTSDAPSALCGGDKKKNVKKPLKKQLKLK